ncbi:unnamed protein product [Meganyctiphanes norvegica]|uniref:Kazal-like domain-containing protein n=1 Tax=Meganyctiphanes norvegica TaxID=48144 RepID=A0AAV2Q0M8_MEGNR
MASYTPVIFLVALDLATSFPQYRQVYNRRSQKVPCNTFGGQIQQESCCKSWYDSEDDCITYDVCVCKDGFEGDACEHDCSNTFCPMTHMPVCGVTNRHEDITFSNMCNFLTSKCNKEYRGLHFRYNGRCQDNITCPPYRCPMDVPVYYYDNPDRPGCKICDFDLNSPC